MLDDQELTDLACPQCGRDPEECGDSKKDWYAQRHICYATRERAAVEALYAARHKDLPFHDGTETEWAKKRSRQHPYHYSDGVTIFSAAVDLNPDDDFLSGTPSADADEDEEVT